ncbi:MAG: prolyl oligopeptidase family serine peptidase [Blastomonas fulva]|uniref:prolyl oligopeptidase family serine peptidase n=1 Tax=Blastomonas fulva TaxID=1550728 RepID=UPI0024E1E542|nr:prolyl oligopeptidase family serine peptidase [Blastomonas fulva]MDK2759418.1 prolyl oligopeptidase family serine peptidase [Blastomonas fulva]
MNMNSLLHTVAIAGLAGYVGLATPAAAQTAADGEVHGPAYLDNSYGTKALDWVKREHGATLKTLQADPAFDVFRQEAAEVLTTPDRLEGLRMTPGFMTQYWQDRNSPMGVWRRSPQAAWLAGKPEWQTLIDFDALGQKEGRRWIFGGASCRANGHCLVQLSDNGKDAAEIREFDLATANFVTDGFRLPEGKHRLWWYDDDTVLVAPVLGRSSLNASLFPKTLRVWKRGEQIARTKPIFTINDHDASLSVTLIKAAGSPKFVAVRGVDFERQEFWLMDLAGTSTRLPLPELADSYGVHDGRLLLRPEVDWTPLPGGQTFAAGSLVGIDLAALIERAEIAVPVLLYMPSGDDAVRGVVTAGNRLFVELLHDGYSRIEELATDAPGLRPRLVPLADDRFVSILGTADGKILVQEESPLTPATISLVDPDTGAQQQIYQRAAAFDARNLVTNRYHAVSADGTRISYTVMHKSDLAFDGQTPTLVYGYGGYDVAVTPRYEPIFGKLWLEKGGVYIHANLRGGGEHGPAWHRATMREGHPLAFDDMEAVLRDVHRRKISSPAFTGIIGRSNGGLLVAAVMQRQPELMNAVVVGGPLIDMLDFHRLPPGGSWLAEYGDPDVAADRAFLRTYSPMQTIAGPETRYPVPLIITATDDDRVLPGHARRYAERLRQQGHASLYFEDDQGGHYWELAGGPAPGDWRRRSVARAAEFTYLWQQLRKK